MFLNVSNCFLSAHNYQENVPDQLKIGRGIKVMATLCIATLVLKLIKHLSKAELPTQFTNHVTHLIPPQLVSNKNKELIPFSRPLKWPVGNSCKSKTPLMLAVFEQDLPKLQALLKGGGGHENSRGERI